MQNGDWGGAAKAALKLNPVSTAARTFDYISDGGLTKGISDAYNRGAETVSYTHLDVYKRQHPAFSIVRGSLCCFR